MNYLLISLKMVSSFLPSTFVACPPLNFELSSATATNSYKLRRKKTHTHTSSSQKKQQQQQQLTTMQSIESLASSVPALSM
jgi:hypothetical protein